MYTTRDFAVYSFTLFFFFSKIGIFNLLFISIEVHAFNACDCLACFKAFLSYYGIMCIVHMCDARLLLSVQCVRYESIKCCLM